MRIAVTPLEQAGEAHEGVIPEVADDEANRLAVAPGGRPPRGFQQGDQVAVVQFGVGIEGPRTPTGGDVRMDRDFGIGQPIGRHVGHVPTLPPKNQVSGSLILRC